MRLGLLALAVVAAMGIAACGGSDSAEPLTLVQRIPGKAEAPGTEPDPVEKRRTASGLDRFISALGDAFVAVTAKEKREFAQAGFVSAIQDTRFYPRQPGAAHTGGEPHLYALVMQFESDEGARKAIELLHADGLKPCPGECAARISEFDVDGTPDAKGVRRVATAEEIELTGEEGDPYDSYAIRFAEGQFAYAIEIFGPPGKVSEEQAEEIAEKLYDRIEGAPPPQE